MSQAWQCLTAHKQEQDSVSGAFGLNHPISDAVNLGPKIGPFAGGKTDLERLLRNHDREGRLRAADIIKISCIYLEYSCSEWDQDLPKLHRAGEPVGEEAIMRGKDCGISMPPVVASPEHLKLPRLNMRYGALLHDLDIAYDASMLNAQQYSSESVRLL